MKTFGAALIAVLATGCAAQSTSLPPPVRPAYLVTAYLTGPSHDSLVETLGPTGKVQRVLFKSAIGGGGDARWAPDGSKLAWVDSSGLHVARSDGSNARLLVRASRHCAQLCGPLTFAWSPDGRKLVAGFAGEQNNRLLVVTARTGAVTSLVTPRPWVEYSVLGWSPNGSWIAYSRYSGELGTRTCCGVDLFVSRPDGSQARRLLSFADPIHDAPFASLSPDSRSIALTSDGRDGDPEFAIVDVRSGRIRRITNVVMVEKPEWSPDSKRLAVVAGNVVTLDTHGRHVRRLPVAAPGGAFLDWTKGGKLVIARGTKTSEVLVSRDGRSRPRRAFRMPSRQVILSIDAR